LLEKVSIVQCSFFSGSEIFAGVVRTQQIVDHFLGQALSFGHIGSNGRAVTTLMGERNPDAAHFFELVR
jgi:hypothetical protein